MTGRDRGPHRAEGPQSRPRGSEAVAGGQAATTAEETYITWPMWYHSAMERTQISLEPEQADRLRRLAAERGVSMAHLIREAVDRTYSSVLVPTRAELWERAMSAVGCGHGDGSNVSENHDDYLDEIYAS